MVSSVEKHGRGPRGPVAAAHGLSCSTAYGIFPDQGSTVSPALAGEVLIPEPLGKPCSVC